VNPLAIIKRVQMLLKLNGIRFESIFEVAEI